MDKNPDVKFSTPHTKYLRLASATVGLEGLDVLEVGGCSPPALVAGFKPASWTCLNLNKVAVEEFNRAAQAAGLTRYSAKLQDIATLDARDQFDRVYSINSFEHISDLRSTLRQLHTALRPGGQLFSLFGPIWSSDVGHHLSIPTPKGEVHFYDGVLDPWEHMTSTPEKLRAKLEAKYDATTAARAVEFIYDYPDINRLCEHEYLEMLEGSGFSKVLVLKNKHGSPPKVAGASATRELLLVLKKGGTGLVEKFAALFKFSFTYLRTRS